MLNPVQEARFERAAVQAEEALQRIIALEADLGARMKALLEELEHARPRSPYDLSRASLVQPPRILVELGLAKLVNRRDAATRRAKDSFDAVRAKRSARARALFEKLMAHPELCFEPQEMPAHLREGAPRGD